MAKTTTTPAKSAKVPAIPPGFNSVSVYMTVSNVGKAVELYEKAFSGKSHFCMTMPDGSIGHAELQIGNSTIMLGPTCPERGSKSPNDLGGSPVGIHIYVEDTDALCKQAAEAGLKVTMPPTDMPWGDRMASLTDPEGHMWSIGTHKEDLSPEVIAERMAQMMGGHEHGEGCNHS